MTARDFNSIVDGRSSAAETAQSKKRPGETPNSDVIMWLACKPRPKIIGKTCAQRRMSDRAGGLEGWIPSSGEMMQCGRPVWGDGKGIGGKGEDMCSRCWHEYNAFHGSYTTLQANPAASVLSGDKITGMTEIFGPSNVDTPEMSAPDFYDPNDWEI